MDTHTLSICTGYGGIELGLKPIMPRIRTVCYVENEVGASKILGARIRDGILDDAPIWTDLRTFDAKAWRGKIHLVTGGFPCQPHSIAGKKQGPDDTRGWERVYTEMQTLIPTFCRVVNGATPQVDGQLRAIGNGVVPAVAGKAWSVLTLSTKK